jgi:hypothetical protein
LAVAEAAVAEEKHTAAKEREALVEEHKRALSAAEAATTATTSKMRKEATEQQQAMEFRLSEAERATAEAENAKHELKSDFKKALSDAAAAQEELFALREKQSSATETGGDAKQEIILETTNADGKALAKLEEELMQSKLEAHTSQQQLEEKKRNITILEAAVKQLTAELASPKQDDGDKQEMSNLRREVAKQKLVIDRLQAQLSSAGIQTKVEVQRKVGNRISDRIANLFGGTVEQVKAGAKDKAGRRSSRRVSKKAARGSVMALPTAAAPDLPTFAEEDAAE